MTCEKTVYISTTSSIITRASRSTQRRAPSSTSMPPATSDNDAEGRIITDCHCTHSQRARTQTNGLRTVSLFSFEVNLTPLLF